METNGNNPLLCDPAKGLCEMPAAATTSSATPQRATTPRLRVVYFTDPICSACWGIEPQLRKLKLEYGDALDIEYRMGGLLPDWSYNSGGISKPSDVAHHWDEVSLHYDMPIDGNVWLEDPLHSSFPPSIAFKAAQMQDNAKAIQFLRILREMVFLQKKNITKWQHISQAATQVGLDVARLQTDTEQQAKSLFQSDLELARAMGVRGFPTLFFIDAQGKQRVVYGVRPYQQMEQIVAELNPQAVRQPYATDWKSLFALYPTLTTREFAELSGQTKPAAEAQLQRLADQKEVSKLVVKNGVLWSRP